MSSTQTNFFHSKSRNKGQRRGRKRNRPKNVFGGVYFKNYNPSMQRPIHANKALHLVLRSSQAKGRLSFKHKNNEEGVWDIIYRHAQKNGITLYEYANAGNHLHILLRVKRRDDYCRFIRTITGLIARLVTGAQRGTQQGAKRGAKQRVQKRARFGQKFWDNRPFSRIVSFAKRDFPQVKTYLLRNTLEAVGWIPYVDRSKKLPVKLRVLLYGALEVP